MRDAVFVDGMMAGYRHYRSAAVVETDAGRYAWIGRVVAPPAASPRVFLHEPPAELYDLRADPEQARDLAAEQPELAAALERRMLDWYDESEARRAGLGPVERKKILSDEERERLRALGYGE